jgi:hypothetical protein
MGLLDKLLGRAKKTTGDAGVDASRRHERAATQERERSAEERALEHGEIERGDPEAGSGDPDPWG